MPYGFIFNARFDGAFIGNLQLLVPNNALNFNKYVVYDYKSQG
jgi:hypothetical protein